MADTHDFHDDRTHMGMPLPHAKLAMWIFLVTEIMFFTALIGVYLLLRNGMPTSSEPWPTPHDVHLIEAIGAGNTFVLIFSSLTVVLAHWSLHTGNTRRAVQYLSATFALGCVFLGVKAYEYYSKWDHQILPGRVHEKLDGDWGYRYLRTVREQLEHIEAQEQESPHSAVNEKALPKCKKLLGEIKADKLSPKEVNEYVLGTDHVKPCDRPRKADAAPKIVGILDEKEGDPHAHVSYSITPTRPDPP